MKKFIRRRTFQQSDTSGFTIIELLTVMLIIMVLAAILFPVLIMAKRASQKAVCLSNLRQLGMAVQLYTNDYDGYMFGWNYPYGGHPPSGEPNKGPILAYRVINVYKPYVKTVDVFQCPADPVLGKNYDESGTPPDERPMTMSYRYSGSYGDWHNDNDMLSKPRMPLNSKNSLEKAYWNTQASFLFGDMRYCLPVPGLYDVDLFDYAYDCSSGPIYTKTAHSGKVLLEKPMNPWPGVGHCVVYPDGHARYCKNWQRYPMADGSDVP